MYFIHYKLNNLKEGSLNILQDYFEKEKSSVYFFIDC